MIPFEQALKAYTEAEVLSAFDIETTGLEPRFDRIVELGAVKFDRRGIIARYSALVNPGIPMPEEASRVNNISDEMLAGEPPIGEILPDFLAFVKNTVIIAHNAPFDCGFVNETLKNHWEQWEKAEKQEKTGKTAWNPPFSSLPNPIADTLAYSRMVFPGLRSYSLQNLAVEFGISALDAHRASDDARICMEIFVRCAEKMTRAD